MRGARKSVVASGLLTLASRAWGQVASVSPTSNVQFKLNIPANTASSGSGDIFFQISAPSTYEWVALGLGSRMSGSNVFVVYTSGDGKNVTVSPRLPSGYNPPEYNSNAQFTLLEGSGVSSGKMVANIKCSNCESWSGSTADFKASTGNWVYAYQSHGGPKNSDDQKATINQHDNQSPFQWSYANAKGGNSVNPLVNAAPAGTGTAAVTATASCVPRPTTSSATHTSAPGSSSGAATSTKTDDDDSQRSSRRGRPTEFPSDFRSRFPIPTENAKLIKRQEINYCDESQPNSSDTGFQPILSSAQTTMKKRLAAHGILAALAFVIFFPTGAIAVRLAAFPGVVWFHAVFQVFAYVVYIAAFGIGVTLADDLEVMKTRHPVIGIVVFVGLFLQPFLGFIHHSLFKRHQERTFVSHMHIWFGRILIALGIINGGLGFKLAEQNGMGTKSCKIAYAVVAAIFGGGWVVAIVIGEMRRSKRGSNPPKYSETPLVERDPVNGHYAPK